MNQFKKLAKAFTTWKSSQKSSSESKQSLSERAEEFFDAQQQLKEYMFMTSAAHPLSNAQLGSSSSVWTTATGAGILAQTVPSRPPWHTQGVVRISVEKVDNGYIMRSSKHEGEVAKVKICTNMDELKDLFVATLVEHQLEK